MVKNLLAISKPCITAESSRHIFSWLCHNSHYEIFSDGINVFILGRNCNLKITDDQFSYLHMFIFETEKVNQYDSRRFLPNLAGLSHLRRGIDTNSTLEEQLKTYKMTQYVDYLKENG